MTTRCSFPRTVRQICVTAAVGWALLSTSSNARAQATAKQAEELDAAVEQWSKALKQARFPYEFQQIAEEALLKMDAAARLERFPAAASLGLTAVAAAGKAQLPWLKTEAAARKKEIDELRTAWEAARKMRTKADMEANLVLGKYLCFVRGDWDVGLGKLMMCADDGLKELAWKTTTVKDDPAALVALGDVWWEKSQATAGKPQAEFQTGAAYLYAQAWSQLERPEADRVAIRLKEAARSTPQGKVPPSIFEVPLTKETNLRMRRLPPGRGVVGSPVGEAGRQAPELQRPVTIAQPLYMGVTEVTQQQWSALVRQNPSRVFGPDLPVHSLTWPQTQRYVSALNRLPIGRRYRFRLPTSDEWEYACRAGTTTPYYYGLDPAMLPACAWFEANAKGEPHPVAKLRPNAWGFYDLLGNVAEWTETSYDPKLYPFPSGATNFTSDHVLARGGAFDATAAHCRSASLGIHSQTDGRDVFGLRIVCEPAAIDFAAKAK